VPHPVSARDPASSKRRPVRCGLAVGYPDQDFPANKLHIGREPIEKNVVFLDS
jgi:hypothetical protein